jgi:hypothetical protein
VGTTSRPPKWIKPQLTRLVDEAPTGSALVFIFASQLTLQAERQAAEALIPRLIRMDYWPVRPFNGQPSAALLHSSCPRVRTFKTILPRRVEGGLGVARTASGPRPLHLTDKGLLAGRALGTLVGG